MRVRSSWISMSAALVLAAGTELATAALDLSSLRNPVWVSPDNLRDPSVLKVTDGYHLFYSRLAGTNWSAPKPFLMEARFLPWNRLERVIDPTLVLEGDRLHCFFVGSANVTNAAGKVVRANLLGHAILSRKSCCPAPKWAQRLA